MTTIRCAQFLILIATSASCNKRATESSPSQDSPSAPATGAETNAPKEEPVSFQFRQLPPEFKPVALYGDGSETVRAPLGATAKRDGKQVIVDAKDFQVVITQDGPSLSDFKQRLTSFSIQNEGGDVLIYGAGGKYNLRVARSLTPEWDDSDVRRFACSAGPPGEVPAPSLTREQVEVLVSICRSIELPTLE